MADKATAGGRISLTQRTVLEVQEVTHSCMEEKDKARPHGQSG